MHKLLLNPMASRVLNLLLVVLILVILINFLYKQPKFSSGELAPDFSAETYQGDIFRLSDHRGDYVLLDFWGSWCGPCRKENRELVSLYSELKNQSEPGPKFHFVSVAIETNRSSFEKAILDDGINWPYQILQLDRFSSEIPKLYRIKSIPTKFLIGPNGDILLANPSISEIRQILSDKIVGS